MHQAASRCEQIAKLHSAPLCRNKEPGLMAVCHPGAPAVIGQIRIYCHQNKEFLLVEVSSRDALQRIKELKDQGWDIEAEIPV